MKPGNIEILTFKPEIEGDFIYIFNVLKTNNLSPNIMISFNDDDYLQINKYGIYTKKTKENYPSVKIQNMQTNGNDGTKILFKFGYAIDKTFTKIENDIYNLQVNNRKENLFAYIFKNGKDRLNYTSVDFIVSTKEENVKFCYTTNLGSFITPLLQNCFRIGKSNPYNLSILNPYIMYKNYYTSEDIMNYYVSFKTINNDQNITITPNFNKYSTEIRNIEGYANIIEILNKEGRTLLTRPSNNEKYLFVQMDICSSDKSIEYEFYNAFYNSNLGQNGKIEAKSKNNFKIIENTYLDTLLVFKNQNKNKEVPEIFIRHTGTNEKYEPTIKDIEISIDKKNKSIIQFNQPIAGEEFNYTIYIDKKDYLSKKKYNLCNFTKLTKLAHYSETFSSKEEKVTIVLDFNKAILKGYEKYDVLILAKNEKLMILSKQKDKKDDKKKLGLILGIVIPIVVILVIAVIIFIRQYKKKNNNIEK